jgi:hypothetical protein
MDMEQTMKELKAAIDKEYVFVHVKTPQVEKLLTGIEDIQLENEQLRFHLREVLGLFEIYADGTIYVRTGVHFQEIYDAEYANDVIRAKRSLKESESRDEA